MKGALSLAGVLCALWLIGCGPARTIDVYVDDLSPQVRRLSATVTLPSARARRVTVQQRLEHFVLSFEPDAAGPAMIRVKGLEEGGCLVAEGQIEARLPEEASAVHVSMAAMERTCGLSIRQVGDGHGAVVADARGWSCSEATCPVPFAPGSTVTLRAVPEADPAPQRESFFTGWAGPCSGRGECQLEVGEDPALVRVGFSLRHVCYLPWCWEAPLPQGNDLLGLWVFDSQDTWAVGSGDTVLRSYGPSWARVKTGLDEVPGLNFGDNLQGIWANGRDDVWVVGLSAILHHDGDAFRVVRKSLDNTETYGAVWASGPKDVWVGGHGPIDPLVLRWDGQVWRDACPGLRSPFPRTDPFEIRGIWGASAEDVWMVGTWFGPATYSAAIIHYGQGTCRILPVPAPLNGATKGYLSQVWGSGPADIYAVGGDLSDGSGFILHWDGVQFQIDARAGAPLPSLSGLFGTGPDDVWFSGAEGTVIHLSEGRLRTVYRDGGLPLLAIHGTPPTRTGPGLVRLSGNGGRTLTWDGVSWLGEATESPLVRVVGPAEGGTDEVYAIDQSGAVLQRSGASFLRIRNGISSGTFTDFFFMSPDEKWGTTALGEVYQHEGQTFRQIGRGAGAALNALSGWPAPDAQRGVRPTHLWAVGAQRTIVHCDLTLAANRCAAEPAPLGPYPGDAYDLYAVWINEEGGKPIITAAGGWLNRKASIILRKEGAGSWYVITTDGVTPFSSAGPLRSIWGKRADGLWFVGDGVIIGTQPGSYKKWESPEFGSLRRLFGLDEQALWIINSQGSSWRWDGTWTEAAWSYERTGARTFLTDLWGRPGQGLWTISLDGSILHRSP